MLDGMHMSAPKCFGLNLMMKRCRLASLSWDIRMGGDFMSQNGNFWQVTIPIATRNLPGKLSARICLGPDLGDLVKEKGVMLGRKSRRNTGVSGSESSKASFGCGMIQTMTLLSLT